MASWSRCRAPARAGRVDLRGLAGGVAAAGLDECVAGARGLELGRHHRGRGSRMSPGRSGFFLTAWVSALGSRSGAAGRYRLVRCRLVRDRWPGRSVPGHRDRVVCCKLLVHSTSPPMRQTWGVPLASSGIC